VTRFPSPTRIIKPHAKTLELPLLVRSGPFFFFLGPKPGPRGTAFAVLWPREGVLEVLARDSIIPVLTVLHLNNHDKRRASVKPASGTKLKVL